MERAYGLYFPLIIDEGRVVYPGLSDSIDSSLRNLLAWPYSKRYFNPAFGTKLWDLITKGVTEETLFLIKEEISRIISEWEPRLSSVNIEVRGEGSSVRAIINAKISNSQPYTFEALI